MEANTKNATKTEMKALYTAFDIHRRVLTLAAMWTAFDPFGAVVHELRNTEECAWDLRQIIDRVKYWDYTKEPYHPLRPIKEGKDPYATFKNHIKGIEGAIRRLLRNSWIAGFTDNRIQLAVRDIRLSINELRSQM